MINLEKIKQQKGQPLLRRPAPASYFYFLFLFFRFPPPREVIKIHFIPFKKGGPNYVYKHLELVLYYQMSYDNWR